MKSYAIGIENTGAAPMSSDRPGRREAAHSHGLKRSNAPRVDAKVDKSLNQVLAVRAKTAERKPCFRVVLTEFGHCDRILHSSCSADER
jgi:hypothetical protein